MYDWSHPVMIIITIIINTIIIIINIIIYFNIYLKKLAYFH